MIKMMAGLASLAFALAPAGAVSAATIDPAALRDGALKDGVALDIIEGLTTEVGQRLAGSPAEDRARAWAARKLEALGFVNVHIEPFETKVWARGTEIAEIISPFPQKLAVAALGYSATTPDHGITAEIAAFDGFDALRDAPDAAVKGKIVFVNHHMPVARDGTNYRDFGKIRNQGPSLAAQKGALAIIIRSVGTDYHRNPHTGVTDWAEHASPIPAGALSLPDADQLARIIARGRNVTLKLVLASNSGTGRSGNVVAEVPGRDPSAGIVLIGGHLDSWDLGTGAVDDAAGVAIATAAAKRIMAAGKPLRTIRVVWFGNEEFGLLGAKSYAEAHKAENFALLAESDTGDGRVWRVDVKVNEAAMPVIETLYGALEPLGVERGRVGQASGSDISAIAARVPTAPVIALAQDATRYFDLHHTPDDTFDKIVVEDLRQNVAAWTAMLAIAANDPRSLGPVSKAANKSASE